MPTIEIKNYDVAYYGGGSNAARYEYRAIIGLRRADGSLIGAAYFHRTTATLPTSDSQNPSGYINCHYMVDDYERVLDLLRNEKPVMVNFTAGIWNMAAITTSGAEPVGEGEPA